MKGKVVEEKDQVRVKRKTLQAVLEECQRALELLSNCEDGTDDDDEDGEGKDEVNHQGELNGVDLRRDQEADEVCLNLFLHFFVVSVLRV